MCRSGGQRPPYMGLDYASQIDESTYLIGAGYARSGLDGAGYEYTVQPAEPDWIVVQERPTWVN